MVTFPTVNCQLITVDYHYEQTIVIASDSEAISTAPIAITAITPPHRIYF
jgi:hypothetical protein